MSSGNIFYLVPQAADTRPDCTTPTPLTQGASLLLRPSPLQKPLQSPCRAGQPPHPFHWEDCHQHLLARGASSQPAILITSFLVRVSTALLSALRTKAQGHSTAPQTLPWDPTFTQPLPQPRVPYSVVPATLALTPSFLSCPFALFLLSNQSICLETILPVGGSGLRFHSAPALK